MSSERQIPQPAETEVWVADTELTREKVDSIKKGWQESGTADASQILDAHPELARYKSAALSLAYDEYCQRCLRGESVDREAFLAKFPEFAGSLGRLLEVHDYLAKSDSESVQWPEPPCTFLAFEIVDEVGRGAFARVYVAREPALGGRRVILKVSGMGAAEAEKLGKLDHPNVVAVHSVQHDPASDMTVICMPYLGQATAHDLLDFVASHSVKRSKSDASVIVRAIARVNGSEEDAQGPTASFTDDVVRLVRECAEGLAYTHSRKILHLDLKPSNILLAPDGQAKLMDFNLSVDSSPDSRVLGGTVPYMPPEQIQRIVGREGPAVDERADIYSLGVLAYELLTGKLPFPAPVAAKPLDELADELLETRRQRVEPPQKHNPAVDAALNRLVVECLSFEPQHRPETMEDVAKRLRRYRAWPRRLRRKLRRNLAASLVGFALTLILAVGTIGYFLSRPSYAEREFARGFELCAAESYEQGIEHLTAAIEADPKNLDFRIVRAVAYQQMGLEDRDYMPYAVRDYDFVRRQNPDPRFDASVGYCYAVYGDFLVSMSRNERAIRNGFETAIVYNNLAATEFKRARNLVGIQHANKAVELDPSLQTAYYTRHMLDLQISLPEKRPPDQALQDLRKAIEIGPVSAGLYRDLARVLAVCSRYRPELLDETFEVIEEAVRRGYDPVLMERDGGFRTIRDDPRYKKIVANRPANPLPIVELPVTYFLPTITPEEVFRRE